MFKKLIAAIAILCATSAFALDVNKATPAELEAVKGIGPALATKITAERQKSSFKDWQDLVTRVNGVGEGNAAKFSTEGLTVNGAAFAGAPAAAHQPKAHKASKADKAASAAPMTKMDAKPAAVTGTAASAPANMEKPVAASASEPSMSKAEKKAAAKKAKEEKKAAKAAAAASGVADKAKP